MSKEIINGWRQWLAKQRDRQDLVGDFARDFLDDPDTADLTTISKIDFYLRGIGASNKVLTARDRAWREYVGRIKDLTLKEFLNKESGSPGDTCSWWIVRRGRFQLPATVKKVTAIYLGEAPEGVATWDMMYSKVDGTVTDEFCTEDTWLSMRSRAQRHTYETPEQALEQAKMTMESILGQFRHFATLYARDLGIDLELLSRMDPL